MTRRSPGMLGQLDSRRQVDRELDVRDRGACGEHEVDGVWLAERQRDRECRGQRGASSGCARTSRSSTTVSIVRPNATEERERDEALRARRLRGVAAGQASVLLRRGHGPSVWPARSVTIPRGPRTAGSYAECPRRTLVGAAARRTSPGERRSHKCGNRTAAWRERAAIIVLATMALGGQSGGARRCRSVLNTGTLRVGVTLFAPWAARGTGGELIGFEADVARQLAADMGVKAQLVAYDVDRLVPALEAGEIDIIAAGPDDHAGARAARQLQPAVRRERHRASRRTSRAPPNGHRGRRRRSTTRSSRSRAVEGSVGATLARRLWPKARVQTFASVAAASNALLRRRSARLRRGRARPDVLGARESGRHRRADVAAAAREPCRLRGQQRRRRLHRVLERLDHRARSRHVAADDRELLVQVVALAGAARRCGAGR